MLFGINAPLTPRNGHTLVVGIVARISGCKNQKEISFDDQSDHCKAYVRMLYPHGDIVYHITATKGKGERLDRPELAELEKLIRNGKLDLLLAEELGRMVRDSTPQAPIFLQ
jgi:site-specific DNA recombinase